MLRRARQFRLSSHPPARFPGSWIRRSGCEARRRQREVRELLAQAVRADVALASRWLPRSWLIAPRLVVLRLVVSSVVVSWTTLLALTPTLPAAAQSAVDLQLVLAVDASGSVDQYRFELQKRGYVAAFRHARVLNAIRSGANQAIAATMVQWTGPMLQVHVVDWTRIGDEESAGAFAAAIERVPRQLFGGGTSISGAIDYARTLFPRNPFRGGRRVIDISGDGSNNRGRPVTMARDEAVAAGFGINGLPILALEPDLDRYFYDSVIGGPGAFVVAAQTYETFADAILKKLITEIAADARERDARQWTCRNGRISSGAEPGASTRVVSAAYDYMETCDGAGHHAMPVHRPLHVHGDGR
jgi:hypothetical protein